VLVARSLATEFEGRLARALADCASSEFSPGQSSMLTPLVHAALGNGAHLLAGEVRADAPLRGPLALAGVSPDAPLMHADVFGPLIGVVTVGSDEEAIAIANGSAYALGATIFSRDEAAARALAAKLSAGVVVINDLIAPTADARLPFGGRKLSGFGATRGREGLLEMTTQKVMIVNRSGQRPHFEETRPWHGRLFLAFLKLFHGRDWPTRVAAVKSLFSIMRPKNRNN
jgi:acyl-CoA reductase-like NAD-dependent aldehyde dehydrogenase